MPFGAVARYLRPLPEGDFRRRKVENAEDVVKVKDEIEVKILRVDTDERKIGLSRKRVEWAEEDGPPAKETTEREKPSQDLKGGLGQSGPLIKTEDISIEKPESEEEGDS